MCVPCVYSAFFFKNCEELRWHNTLVLMLLGKTQVTSAAINGGAMVQLVEDGKTLMVNPIFKWYKEDFDKEGGVSAFIRSRWTGPPIPEDAAVEFFTYDWRTNSVDATWADRALGGPAP